MVICGLDFSEGVSYLGSDFLVFIDEDASTSTTGWKVVLMIPEVQ